MSPEIMTSIYTIAGGTILYAIKEIVRYFTDSKLSRKKLNLETIYPIYVDCFKKAKMMIASYRIPTDSNEFLDSFNAEAHEKLERLDKDVYEDNLFYRQYINLYAHVQKMKNFKKDFNNEFSVNQIFFNEDFIAVTVKIIQEFESDISYLNMQLELMVQKNEKIKINNLVTQSYIDKFRKYKKYLDTFEKEFKVKFKI